MKLAFSTFMTLAMLIAWQKPRTVFAAIVGHPPPTDVLFDAQHPADPDQFRTEGAAIYQLAGRLRIGVSDPGDGAPSAFLLAPGGGRWNLENYRYLEVAVHNVGRIPANVSVFALVPGGFGGINSYPQHENGRELLAPGAQRTIRIDLHQRFPDNTETIDPRNVSELRIILNAGVRGTMIDVLKVTATGQAPSERHDFAGRLLIPSVTHGLPGPGKRVHMNLPGSPVPYVLYLPKDWDPDRRFPVIAEYSGNILYFKNTYSTGKADQGDIGYGMSKGEGAIWVNLPFISQDRRREQLDGFGNVEATAEYARKVIREVVLKYSADPGAVFLTGFSRGGAACGFVGLHDAETADVWLGFHAVGGGDGAGWFGSEMPGALQRGALVKGRSSFVTDGGPWQDVLARLRQPFIFKDSQIGAHVDTMLLDNRPSTVACRKWMEDVLRDRPGVHDISGTVVDSQGAPVRSASVESGYTHLTRTDRDGRFTIRSLVNGPRKVTVHVPGMYFEARNVTMAGKDLTGLEFKAR